MADQSIEGGTVDGLIGGMKLLPVINNALLREVTRTKLNNLVPGDLLILQDYGPNLIGVIIRNDNTGCYWWPLMGFSKYISDPFGYMADVREYQSYGSMDELRIVLTKQKRYKYVGLSKVRKYILHNLHLTEDNLMSIVSEFEGFSHGNKGRNQQKSVGEKGSRVETSKSISNRSSSGRLNKKIQR